MKKISRREFMQKTAAGAAAMTLGTGLARAASEDVLGPVSLGTTNVKMSRVAMGTGSHGWKRTSQQVKLGKHKFLDLAQHAYDQGIRCFETADIYGSHDFVREAFKYVPRDKMIIETKIWHRPIDWIDYKNVPTTVDRFRKELDSDYLDIVLLHCQVKAGWTEKYRKEMDELDELKAKGVIGAVGVSCHDFDALKEAAASGWVDVIQARINAFGPKMDAKPDEVMPVLKKAHDSGKGIIGMKIFGCGDCVGEEQRQKSHEYVWRSGNVDAVTIGFSELDHVDDALKRIKNILLEQG